MERFAAETKTKGGIMLPEKAQGKVLEATVIATGPGARDDKGNFIPMSIKVIDFFFPVISIIENNKIRIIITFMGRRGML